MRGPNQAGKSYLKFQSSSCLAVENVDFLEKFTVFENTENVSFTSILFFFFKSGNNEFDPSKARKKLNPLALRTWENLEVLL